MKNYSCISLLRHAKAEKNLEKRHGGKGSSLISEGYLELDALIANLRLWDINYHKTLYVPRLQCEETARYISRKLNLEIAALSGLYPLNMGILDGLSDNEMQDKYPKYATLLSRCAEGNCEICELKIPQMENPVDFYNRGSSFLDSISPITESIVIVATRSILILLANILLGKTVERGGGYKVITWKNSDILTFKYDTEKPVVATNWSTVSLQ